MKGKPESERASGGPMRRAVGRRCASWVEGTGNILKGRVMGRKESHYEWERGGPGSLKGTP